MKILVLTVLLCTISIMSFSQDLIIKYDGKNVYGEVVKIDSAYVYYGDGHDLSVNKIKRSEVAEIKYASSQPNMSGQPRKPFRDETAPLMNSITVGFLEGGGCLVGFDYELLLSKRMGIQIGGGFVGFGAGLNIHIKPTIRSPYFSFQYWHQGISNSYTQSMVGPSLVFRAKKLFTAQFGYGFLVGEGPARPEKLKDTNFMLTYAIGLYFPY